MDRKLTGDFLETECGSTLSLSVKGYLHSPVAYGSQLGEWFVLCERAKGAMPVILIVASGESMCEFETPF